MILCVLSVVPLLLSATFSASDLSHILCVCVLLALVAVAVTLFIVCGMPHGACQKLLQTGEYTAESKEAKRRTGWFSGFFWCCTVAVYLVLSFVFDRWDLTWIVFPVAALLFAALHSLVQHLSERSSARSRDSEL